MYTHIRERNVAQISFTMNRFSKFVKQTILVAVLSFAGGALCALARTHLVQPGETLYSISKKYEISQEALVAANPTLIHGTHVPAGAVLVIPEEGDASVTTETPGSATPAIVVPQKQESEPAAPVPTIIQNDQFSSEQAPVSQSPAQEDHLLSSAIPYGASTIAVIMPFNLNAGSSAEDKLQMRSVEFYEGVLLAVNQRQRMGQRINVVAYDLGTRTLDDILTDETLLGANLVVGPINASDVRAVAQYCEIHGIDMISPIAYCPDLVPTHTHLYQLNTAKSELYDRLSEVLLREFSDFEFVFVCDSLYASKQDPYPAVLKKALAAHGRTWHDFTFSMPNDIVQMDLKLDLYNSNVLYVPTSSNKETMYRLIPSMKNKSFLESGGALDGLEDEDVVNLKSAIVSEGRVTALFGYPEWQMFAPEFMDSFFDLNVYLFTKFYANPFDEEVRGLQNEFLSWFSKDWMPLQPKYGALGYDVANYGLQYLSGLSGFPGVRETSAKTLQSAMDFVKIGDGGYLNKGFYLVHFTPQTQVEKMEIK